jgi:hypothetical protein
MQALPVELQAMIRKDLDKIAEKTTQPPPRIPMSNTDPTGHANQRSFKGVNVVIDGIDYDKDDLNVSWWFTPDGSIRGRIKLRELRDLIQRHLDKLDAQSLPGPDCKQFMAELQRIQHVATREGEGPSFDLVSAASNLCCDATTGPATEEHLITMAGTACAGAARPEPFPVDLAALHDPDFSNGLSSIEHLNRLSGVAPASAQPAAIAQPTEDPTDDDLLFCYGRAQTDVMATVPKPISLHPGNGLVDRLRAAGLRAVLTRYGRPTLADQLTPKEIEAQECFTELRDEILNLHDGLGVNEVLRIIDNHTPEWV